MITILNDNMINLRSNPPPFMTILASKYLNGVRYFNNVNFLFKSMAIDNIYVIKRIPVDIATANLGFLLIAAIAEPMVKKK